MYLKSKLQITPFIMLFLSLSVFADHNNDLFKVPFGSDVTFARKIWPDAKCAFYWDGNKVTDEICILPKTASDPILDGIIEEAKLMFTDKKMTNIMGYVSREKLHETFDRIVSRLGKARLVSSAYYKDEGGRACLWQNDKGIFYLDLTPHKHNNKHIFMITPLKSKNATRSK